MEYDIEEIAEHIRRIAKATRKPEMNIVSALSDYGILTAEQDMKLMDIFMDAA